MVVLRFQPRLNAHNNYKISPAQDSFIESLNLMLTWPDLPQLVQLAQQRSSYDSPGWGVGLEYPTRPAHQGQVRFWHGTLQPGKPLKTRKCHRSEGDYLGTLAGLMRAHGWQSEAEAVEKIMPLPSVTVAYQPDPFDLFNYKLAPFSYDAHDCLSFILGQQNLALAQERAKSRQGFSLSDSAATLQYRERGQLELTLANGTVKTVCEELYTTLLSQLPSELGAWSLSDER